MTTPANSVGTDGAAGREPKDLPVAETPVVARVAAFLRERDEALEPGEADDEERGASAEAILELMPSVWREDRKAELSVFLDALDEWGVDSNETMADSILKFLVSETGMDEYRAAPPSGVEGS